MTTNGSFQSRGAGVHCLEGTGRPVRRGARRLGLVDVVFLGLPGEFIAGDDAQGEHRLYCARPGRRSACSAAVGGASSQGGSPSASCRRVRQ